MSKVKYSCSAWNKQDIVFFILTLKNRFRDSNTQIDSREDLLDNIFAQDRILFRKNVRDVTAC